MNLKRIVNIMPDDKFLDYYIEMSEKFVPEGSTYLVFTNSSTFKYIKSNNSNILKIPTKEMVSQDLIKRLHKADKIIFHSFNKEHKKIIDSLSGSITLVWFFWGYDGYITQPLNKYVGKISSRTRFENIFWGKLKFLKNFIFNDSKISDTGKVHKKMIEKMDYCATWVEDDFKLGKKINPKLKYLYFNYYTNELMDFPSEIKVNLELKTIMLGNSGSEYNNHAEALLYLREINFTGIIYCPLSYNGSRRYKDNIEKLGNKLFGDNFKSLKEFIPLNEYQDIINSCDVIWMNHKKQQAAGNIFAGLCMSKVVILDPTNPMKPTLEKWGMRTYNKDVLMHKIIDKEDLVKNVKARDKLTFNANNSFFEFLKNMDEKQ